MNQAARVALITPQILWRQALDQLRLQVPEATFNVLFVDSTGQDGRNGELLVNLPTRQSKEWIEARMMSTVQNALRATGYDGPVIFGVRAPPTQLPTQPLTTNLPTPGPSVLKPGDVAFAFLNFDLYARGWLRTPSYYELFWQPVLGYIAYAYWRLMQVLYWSNPSDNLTRRVRLDIQDSAAHLGVSRDLVRGKPAQGLGGALKTLEDFGLAHIQRHATGRATVYTGRFARQLPILAPAQVDQLNPSQQQQHLDWLLSAGYDPKTWETLAGQFPTFILPAGAPPPPPEAEPYVNPEWDMEILSQAGFLRTPVYYDLFLQPLIGPVAYAIWRLCKVLNRSPSGQIHTQDTVTSVYALAAALDCNRQKITGVKRRQDGVSYWQDGAFDILRKERLALIREEGKGSQLSYRLLVVNEPPLLCPRQVETFPENLRLTHDRWLEKARLQLEEWQQLPMDTLLALVEDVPTRDAPTVDIWEG